MASESEKGAKKGGPPVSNGPATSLLSVKQIANHLNVSRSTIHRMVKSGQIPYKRMGGKRGHLRFDVLAVRAALDRHS
jgi:excisionase family DNA binding protein